MRLLGILAALLAIHSITFSATIYVPDNYATIQGAIDASANGDVVIVRPGTYAENIDFVGKAITVQSEQGAAFTTIDGNKAGSAVSFKNGEGLDSVLEGFTLSNGTGTEDTYGYCYGGGIYCKNSSPTITKNKITENSANIYGGGIYCYNSSPVITRNILEANSSWGGGGGINCRYYSSPTIEDNIISENSSELYGGGIFCDDMSSPIINSNIIIGNSAIDDFGSAGDGGGIWCRDSYPTITSNIISNNASQATGGGIYCEHSSPTIANNTISGNNVSDGNGGGIYCKDWSNSSIVNNTIYGNSATSWGGGITCSDHSFVEATNTILWDNDAPIGPEIWIGDSSSGPATVHISYSDVEGGQSPVYVETGSTLNWGPGMIDADPLWVDPVNGDFHLTWNSPCRDTGDNSVVTELYDIEGDPRIALGTVDMGADEFYYHLYEMGDVVPGSPIDIKVVGYPTAPITLYLGSGLADPPYSTQHGDFYLNWPPLWQGNIGTVPGNGVLVLPTTVPSNWTPGFEHPLQALVGPWNGPWTWLTNVEVLVVE